MQMPVFMKLGLAFACCETRWNPGVFGRAKMSSHVGLLEVLSKISWPIPDLNIARSLPAAVALGVG